jgi:hypothetical protein
MAISTSKTRKKITVDEVSDVLIIGELEIINAIGDWLAKYKCLRLAKPHTQIKLRFNFNCVEAEIHYNTTYIRENGDELIGTIQTPEPATIEQNRPESPAGSPVVVRGEERRVPGGYTPGDLKGKDAGSPQTPPIGGESKPVHGGSDGSAVSGGDSLSSGSDERDTK